MVKKRSSAAIAAGSEATLAAGERIAELGGNAADIAVGAAMTAMVSEVLSCSLGGEAFVMVHIPGRVAELIEGGYAVPGRARPRGAPPPRWRSVRLPPGYVDDDHDGGDVEVFAGHASVAVPGALAGLAALWQRYGGLPWRELVAPARELARARFEIAPGTARRLAAARPLLGAHDASRACFYPDGVDEPAAATLYLPQLEDALDYIAHEGARGFYEGDIAALFAREMQVGGGHLTREDLAAYAAATRPPLELASRGFTLAFNPPPAAGGAAAAALVGMLERAWDDAPDAATRALRHARAQALVLEHAAGGGPAWAPGGFRDEHARALLGSESLERHARGLRSSNTTHLSVATADGAVVAITAAMGHGAGVTIPGTGIPCNNAAAALERDERGDLRAQPGARLTSNLCPTVAWHPRDGRALAFGSPGGARIAPAVAQTWVAYALEGLPLEAAVAAPRLHVEPTQEGPRVRCEPGVETRLIEAEFRVRRREELERFFGGVELAAIDAGGRLHAVSDPRGDGRARVAGARR